MSWHLFVYYIKSLKKWKWPETILLSKRPYSWVSQSGIKAMPLLEQRHSSLIANNSHQYWERSLEISVCKHFIPTPFGIYGLRFPREGLELILTVFY